jgi:hypothetical protein
MVNQISIICGSFDNKKREASATLPLVCKSFLKIYDTMQIQYTKIDGDIKSFCDKTDYTYI